MGNLTIALVFVLTLNVLMMLAQASIMDLNPEGPEFYNRDGTILESFNTGELGDDPVLDTQAITDNLPEAEGTISATTGNLFTDTFASIRNWFAKTTGLAYLYGIVSAPYNMLKAMHLPNAFTYAIGTLWYGITFFLIVSFFWGKGD